MIKASCHCRNIQLHAERLPDSMTSCNCSICYRYGALWAYFKPEEVSITFQEKPSITYAWQDKEIDFHHCPVCGCLTHFTSRESCSLKRTAINMRMADPKIISNISIRKFDGADSFEEIK